MVAELGSAVGGVVSGDGEVGVGGRFGFGRNAITDGGGADCADAGVRVCAMADCTVAIADCGFMGGCGTPGRAIP